jgi:hypothetical protein
MRNRRRMPAVCPSMAPTKRVIICRGPSAGRQGIGAVIALRCQRRKQPPPCVLATVDGGPESIIARRHAVEDRGPAQELPTRLGHRRSCQVAIGIGDPLKHSMTCAVVEPSIARPRSIERQWPHRWCRRSSCCSRRSCPWCGCRVAIICGIGCILTDLSAFGGGMAVIASPARQRAG